MRALPGWDGMGADELAGRVASAAFLRSVVAVLINLCGCPLEQGTKMADARGEPSSPTGTCVKAAELSFAGGSVLW